MSQGVGGIHIGLKIVARNPCSEHGYPHWEGANVVGNLDPSQGCKGGFVGENYREYDMGLRGFSAMLLANVFNKVTTADIKDTSNTSQTINPNTATTSVHLVAGDGLTAVQYTNYQIEGTGGAADPTFNSDSPINATVNNTITPLPGGGPYTSGTFTITGTFTNSSLGNETYGNIGITITNATSTFMMAHDRTNGGTGYPVSPSGTVAVTYTVTVS
jgi:hypothetical protein